MQMETQTIYCTICETAWVETTEQRNDIFYCCNMCRDFEEKNEVTIQYNTFEDDKLIDSGN